VWATLRCFSCLGGDFGVDGHVQRDEAVVVQHGRVGQAACRSNTRPTF
jgi:hypothetical protein